MLTRLRIRNFKQFDDVEIELGNPVVFIGPNDSGKTTALQALALWKVGVMRCLENHPATINRKDLIAVPLPDAGLLWRDLLWRETSITIIVDGSTHDRTWQCPIRLRYANPESLQAEFLQGLISPDAVEARVAFLPPMSGLSANETRIDP